MTQPTRREFLMGGLGAAFPNRTFAVSQDLAEGAAESTVSLGALCAPGPSCGRRCNGTRFTLRAA